MTAISPPTYWRRRRHRTLGRVAMTGAFLGIALGFVTLVVGMLP